MKFEDFPVKDVGHSIQLVGGIWAGDGHSYLFHFPEYGMEHMPSTVEVSLDDWDTLLRQSDLMEAEVLSRAKDGKLYKAVVRKCQRQIDQQVAWNVYKRDQYECRYCGRDNVPLTVDHLILWEEGGPSTEDNMLASCKKCNKTRGNASYADWLKHPSYKKVSANLTRAQQDANRAILERLDDIKRVINVRSR